jgi:hypothetical protein
MKFRNSLQALIAIRQKSKWRAVMELGDFVDLTCKADIGGTVNATLNASSGSGMGDNQSSSGSMTSNMSATGGMNQTGNMTG